MSSEAPEPAADLLAAPGEDPIEDAYRLGRQHGASAVMRLADRIDPPRRGQRASERRRWLLAAAAAAQQITPREAAAALAQLALADNHPCIHHCDSADQP